MTTILVMAFFAFLTYVFYNKAKAVRERKGRFGLVWLILMAFTALCVVFAPFTPKDTPQAEPAKAKTEQTTASTTSESKPAKKETKPSEKTQAQKDQDAKAKAKADQDAKDKQGIADTQAWATKMAGVSTIADNLGALSDDFGAGNYPTAEDYNKYAQDGFDAKALVNGESINFLDGTSFSNETKQLPGEIKELLTQSIGLYNDTIQLLQADPALGDPSTVDTVTANMQQFTANMQQTTTKVNELKSGVGL